jgi:hypothetical protein
MRVNIVLRHFDADDSSRIPSGYLHMTHFGSTNRPILLRNALKFVKEHKLHYRMRTPSLAVLAEDRPILATMEFAPWTGFCFLRRVGSSKQYTTYFCFSRPEDLLMFKIGWE